MVRITKPHTDVYQIITDRILQALDKGVVPWHKPWKDGNSVDVGIVPRRHNGEQYRGINVIVLWNEKEFLIADKLEWRS